MNLTKNYKHIHFTGIKGVGMTAVALCMQDLGIRVTGSDTEEYFVTDTILKKSNIKWYIGFGKQNLVPKPDLLITTAAHGGLNNPEVVAAKEMGIPTKTYADALALLASPKKLISVCGVGGKGSTSSMIATVLSLSNENPSYAIGMGSIFPIGNAGKYNKESKYFICEADEFVISPGVDDRPKFSLLNPYITVVTNIEHDHPDIYPSFESVVKVYKEYFARIPREGVLIANIDNINTAQVVKSFKGRLETFGFDKNADNIIGNLKFEEGITTFSIKSRTGEIVDLKISVPGRFNVLNATGAYLASAKAGVPRDKIVRSLEEYRGAKRRFEEMGKLNGALFYDDYAHHPGEIEAALKASKAWYPKNRIVVIFQPHTFSRTKVLFKDFSKAFNDADSVGIMDIYASAREAKDESVSSELLVKEIQKHQSNTEYLGNHKNTVEWIKANVKTGDIVLTLGAGDIFHLYNELKLNIN